MLYLAIDPHSKQITVCVQNAAAETVLRRQVSIRPEKIQSFFQQLHEQDSRRPYRQDTWLHHRPYLHSRAKHTIRQRVSWHDQRTWNHLSVETRGHKMGAYRRLDKDQAAVLLVDHQLQRASIGYLRVSTRNARGRNKRPWRKMQVRNVLMMGENNG